MELHRAHSFLLKILLVILGVATPPLFAADGPTPYPDAKNEAAWPGRGPIRVHPWMVDNRKYFRTQREKDQGAVVFVGDSLTGNWKSLRLTSIWMVSIAYSCWVRPMHQVAMVALEAI